MFPLINQLKFKKIISSESDIIILCHILRKGASRIYTTCMDDTEVN